MDIHSYIPSLKNTLIFKHLNEQQIHSVLSESKIIEIEKDDYIVKQNSVGTSFFILLAGEAESFLESTHSLIASYQIGEAIGQVAAIDNRPRSANVKATQKCTLLEINLDKLSSQKLHEGYARLIKNIAITIANFLRDTNFKKEQLYKEKIKAGKMSIIIIFAICFFAFLFRLLGNTVAVKNELVFSTLMGIFVLIFLLTLMKQGGYKKEFYGLTTKDWKISLKESVLFTLPVLALMTLFQWLLITHIPAFHNLHLFPYLFSFSTRAVPLKTYFIFFSYLLIYIISCPIQELIARGALQGLLKEYLAGTQKWLYIIGANLIFGMLHLYLSIGYALGALLPGLFWGYLYDRHRSIIGVSFSHIMIGVWAIYILGIHRILFG
jgi:hypothetical protein